MPPLERYIVTLNGLNEKPNAVTTTSTGSAVVTVLSPDSIDWVLNVSAMDSITAGHFHAADVNSAGPVMVFVFGGPTTGRAVTGVLSNGIIRRTSTFRGAFTYDSLLTRMRAGTTYLNMHTRRNGGGEIRGQVSRWGRRETGDGSREARWESRARLGETGSRAVCSESSQLGGFYREVDFECVRGE